MAADVSSSPPDFLKLLSHELRWQILEALARSDCRVQELVDRVARPINLVSYHLRQLREAGLVAERRSSADARDVYCSLDLDELARRFQDSGAQLHPLLGGLGAVHLYPPRSTPASVLFLCTHNSARSQMAEALLRARMGPRPLTVASAGSHPASVDPDAVRAMAALGIEIGGQRSKHLDEFQDREFDYVITVCDQVREECPVFPGSPECLHWSIPDPKTVARTGPTARAVVFWSTAQRLAARMDHLLLLLDQDAAAGPRAGSGLDAEASPS